MRIGRLDHLVLTVASIDATVDFYTRVLGMDVVRFGLRAHHGAGGPIVSCYLRDPDQNLIELSNYRGRGAQPA